ncbi:hypothetical protein BDR26DRAFT_819699 [Obelidium mucronatum]|nr:hypothetical protein BDR26DRAFT_819699 [Obelidium mucronatum]
MAPKLRARSSSSSGGSMLGPRQASRPALTNLNSNSHFRLRSVEEEVEPLNDGIRFTAVISLIQDWGGRDVLFGKTTAEVCHTYILPMTTETSSSVCDVLRASPATSQNVRLPNWYVSHVWSYNFIDVVDTLERFFTANHIPLHEAVIWFDVFCIPQVATVAGASQDNEVRSIKVDLWKQTISSVKKCKNMVLIVDSWSDPTPLKRIWCILEMFCASSSHANFQIAILGNEEAPFTQSLLADSSDAYSHLSYFRAEYGVATNARDHQLINKALQHRLEFSKLSAVIVKLFRNWLLDFVEQQLVKSSVIPSVEDNIQEAQWHFTKSQLLDLNEMPAASREAISECLNLREMCLGQDHPETLKARSQFAYASSQIGDNQFADLILQSCFQSQLEILGQTHIDTLTSMSRLAFVHGQQYLFERAEELYKECISFASEAFAESDKFLLTTRQQLANLYLANHRYQQALDLYSQTHKTAVASLGGLSKPTLLSAIGIAETQCLLSRYIESETGYLELTESTQDIFGEHSAQYWKTQTGLALIYKETNRLFEACEILSTLVHTQQRTIGPNHPVSLETNVLLALVYLAQGNGKGEPLLLSSLS